MFELICELMMHSSQQGKAVLKQSVCYVASALAALLVLLTLPVHAFTLGNLHGAAVLGRVLDVTVQVQAGAGEEVSGACVAADVYYADARQTAVKVTLLPAAGAASPAVRVQVSAVIDEPVVTVEVRASCGASTVRRYVLLADLPVPAAALLPLAASGAVGQIQQVQPPVLVLPGVQAASESSAAAQASPVRAGVVAPIAIKKEAPQVSAKPKNPPAAAVSGKPTQVRPATARPADKPVLKLDPLDILSDRIDSLDSLMLFAPAEDALRHSRQISSLEGEVKTLRALAANHDARIADLTTKLQQAQTTAFPVWLLYALLALVVVCLAAVAWLWQRLRQQLNAGSSWWHGPEHDSEDGPATEFLVRAAPATPVPASVPVSASEIAGFAKPVMANTVTKAASVANAVDVVGVANVANAASLSQGPVETLNLAPATPQMPAARVPAANEPDTDTAGAPFDFNNIRHISVESILDIRQQAEFFVSLGQTDRALDILTKQIVDSAEPNPLLYLDLITLYHSLGMKADFRECRDTFHRLFNGNIPDFPAFSLEGDDLQAYPELLKQLTALWPRMEALAFLSTCIFHEAGAPAQDRFDLAAFRELLLLHGLVEVLVPEQPASPRAWVPVAAKSAATASLAVPMPRSGGAVLDSAEEPEGLSSYMLDLDFSALADSGTFPKKS